MTPLLLAAADPLEHVLDHPILKDAGAQGIWWLTNHMVMMVIAATLMLVIFPLITRPYRRGEHVPTGTRNLFEAVLLFVRNDIAKPVLADEADRFMPFLWTLFFFILFNNLLGLLPLEPITGPIVRALTGNPHAHAVYGTATANIWITGALALVSFIVIQIAGLRANGVGNYLKHFLAGAPWYMAIVMIPVEILGMFVKPVALAIRLMANMTAGHILLAVLVILAAGVAHAGQMGLFAGVSIAVILGSVAIMVLETFVAFLQAYIFVFLTALFIGQMVVHEHKEHEGGNHDEAHELVGGGDLTDFAKLPEGARQAGIHAAG
ncbi:MAG: F0F1 ATP synthase subunit A [Phycisphaeraceae bacterium]|nr:F0F1 ATP synthase subunit A [Phycisphaeraceae bacterium]